MVFINSTFFLRWDFSVLGEQSPDYNVEVVLARDLLNVLQHRLDVGWDLHSSSDGHHGPVQLQGLHSDWLLDFVQLDRLKVFLPGILGVGRGIEYSPSHRLVGLGWRINWNLLLRQTTGNSG